MDLTYSGPDGPVHDFALVGRVAALAVARAASQRSAARREGGSVETQPLPDFVSSVIAEQASHTVDERAVDLEALRQEVTGSAERLDHPRRRRIRYGRR